MFKRENIAYINYLCTHLYKKVIKNPLRLVICMVDAIYAKKKKFAFCYKIIGFIK